MSIDGIETYAVNGENPLAAPRGRLSPGSAEEASVARALSISALVEQCRQHIQTYRRGEPSDETYGLELLRRAIKQGDQDAWAGLQQCVSVLVRDWLYGHPCREAACRLENEETYVVLAFERFWQATAGQQVAFRTLVGALAYLRASLHGAILDTLRAYARPKEVHLLEPGEPYAEDQITSSELWEILQRALPYEREQRLAYLLYHCGLKPREIVHFCPQEWSEVQEIYRLRRNILERLMRQTDHPRWRLSSGGA